MCLFGKLLSILFVDTIYDSPTPPSLAQCRNDKLETFTEFDSRIKITNPIR